MKIYMITKEQFENTEYRPLDVEVEEIETEEDWTYKDVCENQTVECELVVDARDLYVYRTETGYVVELKETPIREARTESGLTQQRLSDISGIPKRTIENWEGGQRSCPDWTERLVVNEIRRIGKMMNEVRYIVVDTNMEHGGMDEWHDAYADIESANAAAAEAWDRLTAAEKKERHIYVATVKAEYLNDDCFEDGEITDWDGFNSYDVDGFDSEYMDNLKEMNAFDLISDRLGIDRNTALISDYLTINTGRDGKTYAWYYDGQGKDAFVEIGNTDICEDPDKSEKLFA